MTKVIPIMLALSVLSLLPGCGSNDSTSPGAATAPPSSPAGAPAAPTPAPAASTEAPVAVELSPWTAPATEAPATGLCSIDAVDGQGAVNGAFKGSAAKGVTIEGWVASPDKQVPHNIAIVLDGASDFQITGSTGAARPDVATAFGPGLANAGFKIELAELNVPAGEYAIKVAPLGQNSYVCTTQVRLVVQ